MMLTLDIGGTVDRWLQAFDVCPWPAHAGASAVRRRRVRNGSSPRLYTEEQRRRRDSSHWTLVQGILAPVQFAVFLVSLCLVLRYLLTGEGATAATASIVVKTLILYTIMVTGSLWERDVFGRYLFARPFFWEDIVSMLVLALHTAYLAALLSGTVALYDQMIIALAAYAAYVVNAAQFLVKLRMARRERDFSPAAHPGTARLAK